MTLVVAVHLSYLDVVDVVAVVSTICVAALEDEPLIVISADQD